MSIPLGGIGQMQRGPACVIRKVGIGPMLEKSLRARIHTFPGRLMQRRGTAFVAGVDIRPRLNQEIGAARGRLPAPRDATQWRPCRRGR